jgi:isopentenyl-diphosphate Delta-isomerase
MREEVVLVNDDDEVIGVAEKLAAHRSGDLHRAFSIFVFNSAGQLLLQKRAAGKYHSNGLWSNTCCGHPRPGEPTEEASRRRLYEEMGFECGVRKVLAFTYHAELEGGLFEHEYDHVFVGQFDGGPAPNHDEVSDWKWVGLPALRTDIRRNPGQFTYWFKVSLDQLCSHVEQPVTPLAR